MASVARTRRAVIVDEGWRTRLALGRDRGADRRAGFWQLDAPVGRVCSAEVPIPYPKHLEQRRDPAGRRHRRRGPAALAGD